MCRIEKQKWICCECWKQICIKCAKKSADNYFCGNCCAGLLSNFYPKEKICPCVWNSDFACLNCQKENQLPQTIVEAKSSMLSPIIVPNKKRRCDFDHSWNFMLSSLDKK